MSRHLSRFLSASPDFFRSSLLPGRRGLPAVCLAILLFSCVGPDNASPLLRAEPETGAELERAPRTLRLYFEALPDVSQSNLRLLGAAGEYPLRGLHTMAADDLMVEITEPLPAGDYTVEWTTRVGSDPTLYAGSYTFTVLP